MKKTVYEIETIIDQIERDSAKDYDLESLGDCHCDDMRSVMSRMSNAETEVEFDELIEEAKEIAEAEAKAIAEALSE